MAGLLAGPIPLAAPRVVAQPAMESVTMGVSSTSFVIGGMRIGQEAGIFARHGLDVRVSVMESGNAGVAALLSGSIPFVASGPPDVLVARARGQDVVIIANLYAGFAGSVVLGKAVVAKLGVAPDAPVPARLKALDGLLLAMPSATSALLAPVREATAQQGAKVRFTFMAQTAMPAALESGAVAGIVASYPFAGAPLLRGTGVLWISGPAGQLPPDTLPASSSCIQATGASARANLPLVRRLQAAVVETARFIENDRAAAKAALTGAYKQLSPVEVDLAFDQQWRNWTKPFLTSDDIRQEARLIATSVRLPGLDQLDPASVLIGPA